MPESLVPAVRAVWARLSRPLVAVPILVALAALSRWPFVVDRPDVAPPPDTGSYLSFADAIAGGRLTNDGLAPRARGLRRAAGFALGTATQRRIAAALLAVWLPLALAIAATHGGLPRYSASLLPLTYVASLAGAVLAARAIARAAGAR